MDNSGDYISREAALDVMCEILCDGHENCDENTYCCSAKLMKSIPAADVRPVVLCGVCELHRHCYTEDVFAFARLAEANRFCAVGKAKTNGERRRKADGT